MNAGEQDGRNTLKSRENKFLEYILDRLFIEIIIIKTYKSFIQSVYSHRNKLILNLKVLLSRMRLNYHQGPNFDDMPSFFPCEIDDAIQYINLGNGPQAPKINIL